MTFNFGKTSCQRLATVKIDLRYVMTEAIKTSPLDFGINCGFRTAEEQARLFAAGKSKVNHSKHQDREAVDVAIYVGGAVTWDEKYYYMLAGHILATAKRLGVGLRWGGDWDGDTDLNDQTFNDLVHYELHGL